MPCPENSIYIIIGEMNMVVTAMKRSNRWSSHVHQEEEQDSLLKSFNLLKGTINNFHKFEELEPIVYLSPFLDVIRSENTSGLVTGHGLSAVYKFLTYGLIGPKSPSAAAAAENIADAVTHARFMMIDSSSDEIVLMKIIQVLRILLLSPIGTLLTNESVCEIIQSFFRMCFETRFSEILRKTAENAVVDTVQLLFSCLPQFTDDNKCTKKLKMHSSDLDKSLYCHKRLSVTEKDIKVDSYQTGKEMESSEFLSNVTLCKQEYDKNGVSATTDFNVRAIPQDGDECTDNSETMNISSSDMNIVPNGNLPTSDQIQISLSDVSLTESKLENIPATYISDMLTSQELEVKDQLHVVDIPDESECIYHDESDYVNPRGVRFTPHQTLTEGSGPLMPYGLPCVRELFRLLVSLINPLDRHNTDATIQIGLNLITVALETGAENLGKFISLLTLIKDEMCRNLFSLLSTDRLPVFSTALRVFFLLFEALRTHLKFQLEMFLMNLMDIITSESSKVAYEQREISLDCITQLWRIPSFVTEMYINYDCDLYCTNLFEHLTKSLSKNAFPMSGLYSVQLLSLDALLAVIDNIENHCHCRMLSKTEFCPVSSSPTNSGDPISVPPSIVQQGFSGYHFGQQLLNNHVSNKDAILQKSNESPSLCIQPNRMKISLNIPSHEEIMAIKHKKKILASGTEQFNSQPAKGIMFLQDHGLLVKPLDSYEVASFLRDNPRLDKKMIGEYVSNRKNLKVLEAFVKSFIFLDTRIDEALRQYLETFRLPGEAPLISLIMEHFAEHWHTSNNHPFANSDAAFTLAYAIIMLNVDQHNHNVKKQINPMTLLDFKKNLKNVNGGKDFDENMLEAIYMSIRNEEIVMPAEQTGLVRENYLWKVLLRRGTSKEGKFMHTPNGVFDHDLFSLIWGPTVAALSFIFDKSIDANIIEKTISGFHKCAMIAAHYGMCDVFDNLIISLCKFTLLVNTTEIPKLLPIVFGNNSKAQMAVKAVFRLAHCHGDILREGWKNLLDCVMHLFKAKLLPQKLVEAEDFLSPNGLVCLIREDLPCIPRAESGIFSSFYSYITSDSLSQRPPSQEEETARKAAKDCIEKCYCEQLFAETKFLRIDSLQELVKTLIFLCPRPEPKSMSTISIDEDSAVFILELLIKIVLLNRDRVASIWSGVQDHMFSIIMNAAITDNIYLLERTVVGILRIAVRLVCKEELIPRVLQSLRVLLYLKTPALLLTSRQVAYALSELLKTNAANIHDAEQWSIIFLLLERVGAGARSPQAASSPSPSSYNRNSHSLSASAGAQSDSELSVGRHIMDSDFLTERGYTSDSELYESSGLNICQNISKKNVQYDIVSNDAEPDLMPGSTTSLNHYNIILHEELTAHDSLAFLKCCECLAFLVRDAAHITSDNFESCVHCLRTFVEASANGGFSTERRFHRAKLNREKKVFKSSLRRKEEKIKRSHSYQLKSEAYDADDEEKQDELSPAYQQASLQLLDLMHTLHTRASSICNEEPELTNSHYDGTNRNLWSRSWCPLLQGIARLCCDNRLEIRTSALSLLQRALLVHDLQTLSPTEWEACFNKVLFPLLAKLLEDINPEDLLGMEETRTRGANLLCKVFLQHLTPLLTLPTFLALWLTILDFMDKYMKADFTGSLAEAIPESLKNMLLVMDTASVFQKPEEGMERQDQIWHITWDRINTFLPYLKDDLFRPSTLAIPAVTAISSPPDDSEELPRKTEKLEVIGSIKEPNEQSSNLEIAIFNASQTDIPSEQDNTYLSSPTYSVILHPPAIHLDSPISTESDKKITKDSNQLSDSRNSPITMVPLFLDPSGMQENRVSIISSQVSTNASSQSILQ